MWSRIRHRRLQALVLVALSALMTTSLCLGPLYQRAMEQALTGSALREATPAKRAVTLSSHTVEPTTIGGELPHALAPYFGAPVESSVVDATARTVTDGTTVVGRVYAPVGLCDHVRVVSGACPTQAGEVMVSADDAKVNGWQVGGTIAATQRGGTHFVGEPPHTAKLVVVGLYAPVDDGWLGAPATGRVGQVVLDPPSSYVITDDWVTVPETLLAKGAWDSPTSSASWPLDLDAVDVDALLRIGPQVDELQQRTQSQRDPLTGMTLESDLGSLATQVGHERGQARTTVGVLVAQLAVLVGIVLWMVLVSATDERRRELALARLRGRGRSGASRYLLAELLPLALAGVVVGALLAPPVMTLVARLVFPLAVPVEVRLPVVATALVAAVAVALVVLAAARRAAREPVDSLLRGVPAPRAPGVGETAVVVVSLTAVVALVTVDLAGPLATLAPTLLAVAVGLLLARVLRRSVLVLGRWLLRRGRSAAGAGVLTSVRRPAARRVLVMVVVAAALVVFCSDALVTGRHNRADAAEQASGAPYVLAVRPADLNTFVAALAEVDPSGTRLTPVVATYPDELNGGGPTLAVAPQGWADVADFPLQDRDDVPWRAIQAPQVTPVEVAGRELRGEVRFSGLTFDGSAELRSVVRVVAEVRKADGGTREVPLARVPAQDGVEPFHADLFAHPGWYLTGLGVTSASGLAVSGTIVLSGLTLDGAPLDLGGPDAWRPVTSGDHGTVRPIAEDGDLGMVVEGANGPASPMLSTWVPDPVPAIVTSPEATRFEAPGLSAPTTFAVAARLPRVSGFPPGARVVDLAGLLRRSDAYPVTNASVEVWSRDRALLDRAAATLRDRGIAVDALTTQAQARQALDDTPAAWSLALSVLVGGAAVLVAALVMLVVAATTWRARALDLAALRMTGLRARRLLRVELVGALPMVLLGCLAGAASGAVSASFALPDVRQFTEVPAVPTTDFSVPWVTVVGSGLAAAVLLTLVACATAAWTARRARLGELRQGGLTCG